MIVTIQLVLEIPDNYEDKEIDSILEGVLNEGQWIEREQETLLAAGVVLADVRDYDPS